MDLFSVCFCCFPTRSLIYRERRTLAHCILFTQKERGQPVLSSFAKPEFRSLMITKGYLRKILVDHCISNIVKKACRHHSLGGCAVLLPLVSPCGPQLAHWQLPQSFPVSFSISTPSPAGTGGCFSKVRCAGRVLTRGAKQVQGFPLE